MVNAPGITATNETILYRIAESLSGAEPKPYLNAQEAVLKRWYTTLATGNYDDLMRISCEAARGTNGLMGVAMKLFDIPDQRSTVVSATKRYNFNYLKYYTVGGNDRLSVVRVCGNVVDPSGQFIPFYQFASRAGNSNMFVINLENGEWKVCQNHHL